MKRKINKRNKGIGMNRRGQQLVGEGIATWILWIVFILIGLSAIGYVLWRYVF